MGIWQKIVSLKDNIIRHISWSSKNKDIINRFHETARRSMEEAAPDSDLSDNTTKPPEKREGIPPRLTAILKSAQKNTVEESLSQQARVKDLYEAEGLYGTARRFFNDPRITVMLTTGLEQLNHDIRFVSDGKIEAVEIPAHDIEPSQKALYSILSTELINAADPDYETKSVLRRIASLEGVLRGQGLSLKYRIVEDFEAAIKEYGDSLKDPSSKVVAFKPKPREPGGIQ